METTQQINDLKNELIEIRKEYNELHAELKRNQELLIELLKTNNNHTKKVYEATVKDKSAEQQTKDFLMNVAANLVGNTIGVPNIINVK